MRILFVWDSDYPWDIRVEKVCRSLIEAGHHVHLVCRNLKRRPRNETVDGMHLHRLPAFAGLPRALSSALSFPFFFNPVWLYAIRRVAKAQRCEVILVRDLPMAPSAIWIARLLGIPVVLDMAECYPELLRATWRFERFRLSNLLVRNPRLADALERWCVRRLDQIWVMVEESRERLIALGVPAERIAIVSNTPVVARYDATEASTQAEASSPLRLVYVGLLNPSRGIDTMIRAVALARGRGLSVHLDIIGTGKAQAGLQVLTQELRLESEVTFRGWIDSTRIPGELRAADVGIVPHRVCSHWNTTIPNKLFDYMAAGKPVIVSDARPAARIVRETGAGLSFPDDDAAALADQIQALCDPALRSQLSRSGRAAIEAKYRWDTDERVLTQRIAQLQS
jgi:glycosyltransferase involved in cell wall biosynthesis